MCCIVAKSGTEAEGCPLFKATAPRKVCESPCYVLENATESNWFHSHLFQRVKVDEKCYAQPPGPNYQ